MRKLRRLTQWVIGVSLSLALLFLSNQRVGAQPATPPTTPAAASQAPSSATDQPTHREPASGQPTPASAPPASAAGHRPSSESHASGEEHAESPWALIARIVNFLILLGGLVYFLRSPFAQHLVTRSQQIRADLVSARETTDRARTQMAAIDQRLKELPADLEALKARGAVEVAAEGLRIRQQAEAERQRLVEQTRREVELQVRLARRSLAEHTADLAVRLASDRIAATITADDHGRLIDQYVSRVKELHG